MTAHTPGPWAIDGFCMSTVIRCIVPKGHPDAKHTCGDWEVIARCEGDNWRANALLIAAATDVLDALIMVRDADDDDKSEGRQSIPASARAKIDAAIAKAEGRS